MIKQLYIFLMLYNTIQEHIDANNSKTRKCSSQSGKDNSRTYDCLFHMTLPNKKIQHYLTQVVKLP